MKPDIFVHFAPVAASPLETAKILIGTMHKYGSEVGGWYAQLIKGCFDSDAEEYEVCYETLDLKGETDLLLRIEKNGSGAWDTYTTLFNGEFFYIHLYPASPDMKTTSVIIHISGATGNGDLARFMQTTTDDEKRPRQLALFREIALSVSADYYGIWAADSIFLPLEPGRFYAGAGSLFFVGWKQDTLDEKSIPGKLRMVNTGGKSSETNPPYLSAFIEK